MQKIACLGICWGVATDETLRAEIFAELWKSIVLSKKVKRRLDDRMGFITSEIILTIWETSFVRKVEKDKMCFVTTDAAVISPHIPYSKMDLICSFTYIKTHLTWDVLKGGQWKRFRIIWIYCSNKTEGFLLVSHLDAHSGSVIVKFAHIVI